SSAREPASRSRTAWGTSWGVWLVLSWCIFVLLSLSLSVCVSTAKQWFALGRHVGLQVDGRPRLVLHVREQVVEHPGEHAARKPHGGDAARVLDAGQV